MLRIMYLKRYSFLLLISLCFPNTHYGQGESKRIEVGDIINEVVYAKGADNLTYELPLKSNVPSKSLIVLYRFNDGENINDNADSIRYVETITSFLGNTLKNDYVYLRPYVISGTKERLAKLGFSYHYEHSIINKKTSSNNITGNSVFSIFDTITKPNSFVKSDKIIITNYKGKVLAMSRYIAGFSYNGKKMPEILDYMSKVKNPEPMTKLDSVKNDITLIPPVTLPVTIKGKVLAQKSANETKPINLAYVTIIQELNAQKFDTVSRTNTDGNGDFTLILPDEKGDYKLRVVSPDKSIGSIILTNKSGFEISALEKTYNAFEYRLIPADVIKMKEVSEDDLSKNFNNFKNSSHKEIKITENLLFASGKYDVEPSSMAVLDKVILILIANASIKLEVISHTDAIGSESENLELSNKRSAAVMRYFISKGIAKNRLKAIGKGESEIRNRCKNDVECSEAEHAFNRRTEFHFIKK
ncbi:MAG: OmpA family protein [Bacteroidota bacterium]